MLYAYGGVIVTNTAIGVLANLPAEQWKTFIYAMIALRLLQGYFEGVIGTQSNAIMFLLAPDHRDKILAMQSIGAGVGAMLGPPVGSILYTQLGFQFTFYTWHCSIARRFW